MEEFVRCRDRITAEVDSRTAALEARAAELDARERWITAREVDYARIRDEIRQQLG